MTMFHFQRSWLEDVDAAREDMGIDETASPREAVRSECRGYLPIGFENCTGIEAFDEPEALWCSFDPKSKNFHIVPSAYTPGADEYIEQCNKVFGDLKRYLPQALKFKARLGVKITMKNHWKLCHRYNYVQEGEWQYLIGFNRFSCNGMEVSNHLGRVQFMRCKEQINENINGFKLMYPPSPDDEDEKFDRESGHCVYNAPFSFPQLVQNGGETVEREIKELAECFSRFVMRFREGE